MTDSGIDPTVVAGAAGAAKYLFSFMKGDIKPCTMRPEWTGLPYLSDRIGYHPMEDGRFHKRLMRKGLVRVLREWVNGP